MKSTRGVMSVNRLTLSGDMTFTDLEKYYNKPYAHVELFNCKNMRDTWISKLIAHLPSLKYIKVTHCVDLINARMFESWIRFEIGYLKGTTSGDESDDDESYKPPSKDKDPLLFRIEYVNQNFDDDEVLTMCSVQESLCARTTLSQMIDESRCT